VRSTDTLNLLVTLVNQRTSFKYQWNCIA